MSAMVKHIGTEIDYPSMGSCVGGPEIGYLYGQVNLSYLDFPTNRTLFEFGVIQECCKS